MAIESSASPNSPNPNPLRRSRLRVWVLRCLTGSEDLAGQDGRAEALACAYAKFRKVYHDYMEKEQEHAARLQLTALREARAIERKRNAID